MANKSETWSNLLHSDDTARKMEGPTTWEKVASALSGVGNFASGWAAEQIHAGTQDFVSRVLLGESYTPPEAGKEREAEPDKGDPDKDHGMER